MRRYLTPFTCKFQSLQIHFLAKWGRGDPCNKPIGLHYTPETESLPSCTFQEWLSLHYNRDRCAPCTKQGNNSCGAAVMIPECDRQTDGRTSLLCLHQCLHSLLCYRAGKQESCAIAKMTAQCALYMGALKNFGTPWLRPGLLFPTIDPMNVPTKFEVRRLTRSWDNRGTQNLGSSWIRHAPFSPKL